MSIRYVADTMAVVLHCENRRLPKAAQVIFAAAGRGEFQVGVSAMTLAEIGYLFEKKRIALSVDALLSQALALGLVVLALDDLVVQRAFQIIDIPELHDRLIAATAWQRSLPLLTNDPVIRASAAGLTRWE